MSKHEFFLVICCFLTGSELSYGQFSKNRWDWVNFSDNPADSGLFYLTSELNWRPVLGQNNYYDYHVSVPRYGTLAPNYYVGLVRNRLAAWPIGCNPVDHDRSKAVDISTVPDTIRHLWRTESSIRTKEHLEYLDILYKHHLEHEENCNFVNLGILKKIIGGFAASRHCHHDKCFLNELLFFNDSGKYISCLLQYAPRAVMKGYSDSNVVAFVIGDILSDNEYGELVINHKESRDGVVGVSRLQKVIMYNGIITLEPFTLNAGSITLINKHYDSLALNKVYELPGQLGTEIIEINYKFEPLNLFDFNENRYVLMNGGIFNLTTKSVFVFPNAIGLGDEMNSFATTDGVIFYIGCDNGILRFDTDKHELSFFSPDER